jgi:hypothetical protein
VLPWFTPEGLTDETQVVDSHNGTIVVWKPTFVLQVLSSSKTITKYKKNGSKMKQIYKSGRNRAFQQEIDES